MEATKTYKPLDDLIDNTGLKKKVIAEKMGVDYGTFYKWRIKPSTMNVIELDRLADVTGLDFMVLFKVVKKFDSELDKSAS